MKNIVHAMVWIFLGWHVICLFFCWGGVNLGVNFGVDFACIVLNIALL